MRIGADGECDTNRASQGRSTGSANVIESKDELVNGSMKGCVTGENVGQGSVANGSMNGCVTG